MKKIIRFFLLLSILFLISNNGKSQIPTYKLTAQNFVLVAPNTLEFDIYILHTNFPIVYEHASIQFAFLFDSSFANGGTLSYTIAPANTGDSSDLPFIQRPRAPAVFLNSFGQQVLAINSNIAIPAGSGYLISHNGLGTKVLRMRLQTTAANFTGYLKLRWRNWILKPNIKLFARVNGVSTQITDSTNHIIDSSYVTRLNITLAIEGLYRPSQNILFMRDTAKAYLRNTILPYAIVDSSKTVIDSISLTGSFTFRNATNGTYYIVIKHRNSIETWSKAGGELVTNGVVNSYDFTTSASQAYGGNMVLVGNKYCIYSGNSHQDGIVDASDLSEVENDSYNSVTGYVQTDFTGNNFVDASDLSIVNNNVYQQILVAKP